MKTTFVLLLMIPGAVAQNCTSGFTCTQILTTGTALHDRYLFNASYSYDQQDQNVLPWTFYWNNASTSPSQGTRRKICSLVQNPNTLLYWYSWPAQPPSPPSEDTPLGAVLTGEPYATTGEYMESPYVSLSGSVTGFSFDGELNGVARQPGQEPNFGYYEQAAYFSDRECFDGGVEYGWYKRPIYYECSFAQPSCTGNATPVRADDSDNVVYFYYSLQTNCGYLYVCASSSNANWEGSFTDGDKNNYFGLYETNPPTKVTFAQNGTPHKNSRGTYEWVFRALHCPAAGCAGVSSSANSFVLDIIDPKNCDSSGGNCWKTPITYAPCTVQGTSVTTCQSVVIPINVPSGFTYPATNTGYVTFTDQSSTNFPSSANYYCCGPPPAYPYDVIGTNGRTYAGLYVNSAFVWSE